MDFSLLFDPVDSEIFNKKHELDSVFHSLYIFQNDFPELDEMDIVIFSVDDNRGTANHVLDAGTVREEFYQLKQSSAPFRVVDLGCLRPGPEYSDTLLRVEEVLSYLFDNNILPILLNGSQDLIYSSYKLFAENNQKVNVGIIDRLLDIEEKGNLDECFVNDILEHTPNVLGRFKFLAYQSYLVSGKIKSVFEKLSFEELRLGKIKKEVLEAEPIARNVNLASFDLSAIKSTEFPSNGLQSVFGLTVEEACQLVWYLGFGGELKFMNFSNFWEEEDENRKSAHGLAVMLWYLLEGFYSKTKDDLTETSNFIEYKVDHSSLGIELVFFKSKTSDRWWIHLKGEKIPCSYLDYRQSCDGLLPGGGVILKVYVF